MMKFFRNEYIQAALILIIALFVGYHSVIFSGKTLLTSSFLNPVLPRDVSGSYSYADAGSSAWEGEPNVEFVKQSLKSGILPLWASNIGLGIPFAATLEPDLYFPLKLILYINSSSIAWDFFLLFRLLLAGFFAYLFFREIKLNKISSLTGAISFMLCGYFTYFVNIFYLNIEVLIPLLLLSFEKFIQTPSKKHFSFICLSLIIIFTSGNPEASLMSCLLAYFYYFSRVFTAQKSKFFFYLKFCLLFSLLALGSSAFYCLPFLEYLPLANHIHTNIGAETIGIKGFISLVIPFFFRVSDNSGYWIDLAGRLDPKNSLGYLGILPILIFLATPWSVLDKKYKALYLFFYFFSLALLLKLFGAFFINWIGYLPGLSSIIYYKYHQPILAFSVTATVAIASQYFMTKQISLRNVVFSTGILIILISIYLATFSLELRDPEINAYVLKQVGFGVILLITFLLFYYLTKYSRFKFLNPFIIITLISIELLTYNHILGKSRSMRVEPFPNYPYLEFLQQLPRPFRTFAPDGNILHANTSLAYGLDDIRTILPLLPKSYVNLYHKIIPEFHGNHIPYSSNDQLYLNSRIFDLINIKYLLSNSHTPPPMAGLKLIYDDNVQIYENTEVLERAFIAHAYRLITDEAQMLETLANDPTFDIRNEIILEIEPPIPPQKASSPEEINITDYRSNEVIINANLSADGFIVLSDQYYPGWKAYVDETKTAIYKTNYTFRSVFVAKGQHVIRFSYEPHSFRYGVLISLFSLMLVLLLPKKYFNCHKSVKQNH